ncbi:MAG: DNA topoisomerase IV subunit A [Culicoidibacterales bacterium]
MDGGQVRKETLEQIMGERFGRYSKYIIQERALPDARDGLKPVQRRILYAMHKEGNSHDKAFRKSAKTVGNVIGNYHPHGDSSVYEAMVRMSQDWKLREVLVEMHGNNGSMDGDSAAAMRYTEARLAKISALLVQDLEKQTVDFVPNFDDSELEPTVLPARFPALLVNGSTGISAGYATEIPPHNLGEIIDATIYRIESPNSRLETLMNIVQGPDFPTGAIAEGKTGLKQAYETGRGRIMMRAKMEVKPAGNKKQLIITELPYEVNKATLVRKIDEMRIEKNLEAILEVRDESDRQGLRVVVDLRKDADEKLMRHVLLKNTELQVAYNFNMVAIHQGRPVQMGLIQMLDAYIDHQLDVVIRRSNFELKVASDRQHLVEGLIKAISMLDVIIQTIRQAKDKKDAITQLCDKYGFTTRQADAIVSLQLYRLTSTDITGLEAEHTELSEKITYLLKILEDDQFLRQVIKDELKAAKKQFATPRKTAMREDVKVLSIEQTALIPKREGIVTMTRDGYLKMTSNRSFASSKNEETKMKDNDRLISQFALKNTDTLVAFANNGSYTCVPVYRLPDVRWKDLGQHISAFSKFETNLQFVRALALETFDDHRYIITITKKGMVKRTSLADFTMSRTAKAAVAMTVKADDELHRVFISDGASDIILLSQQGFVNRFHETEIPQAGARAAGVKGIKLVTGDELIDAVIIGHEPVPLLFISERGIFKHVTSTEIEVTGRFKKGFAILKQPKINPHRLIAVVNANHRFTIETETHEEEINPTTIKFTSLDTTPRPLITEKIIDAHLIPNHLPDFVPTETQVDDEAASTLGIEHQLQQRLKQIQNQRKQRGHTLLDELEENE